MVCLQGRDWVNWMTREMKMRKLFLKETTALDNQTDHKVRGFLVVLEMFYTSLSARTYVPKLNHALICWESARLKERI